MSVLCEHIAHTDETTTSSAKTYDEMNRAHILRKSRLAICTLHAPHVNFPCATNSGVYAFKGGCICHTLHNVEKKPASMEVDAQKVQRYLSFVPCFGFFFDAFVGMGLLAGVGHECRWQKTMFLLR